MSEGPIIFTGGRIPYLKKTPVLKRRRANELIAVANGTLRMRIKNRNGEQAGTFLFHPDGSMIIIDAEALQASETAVITGPATVYEEDGETIHATVAEGETYNLAIAYREVTETINGNCEFKRMVKCSLPYILE